jgi:uncharacterized damage-inducible protein DinB
VAEQLLTFYSGWGEHNSLLKDALSGLDADQLSIAPADGLWSVRMLASHIVANRAWWFHSWMGEGGHELSRFIDYDEGPDAATHSADEIVAGLGRTWSSVASSLQGWTEHDLAKEFQRPSPNDAGERPWRTRKFIIWHVAEHDVHHSGEISLILGMNGLTGLDM